MRSLRYLLSVALVLLLAISLVGCAVTPYATVRSAHITENGELILEYTNGYENNLGVVIGQAGVPGQDGKDGAPGQDGKDGLDGKDGVDGKDGPTAARTDLEAAVARGLRSAVSVISTFKKTADGAEYHTAGAGVIYRLNKTAGSAFIITNHHVVYDQNAYTTDGISHDITVYLYGAEYNDYAMSATYVGGSAYYDIAVLYVSSSDLLRSDACMAIEWAEADDITLGQTAIAIGNAEGDGLSVTSGIVCVDSEQITMPGDDFTTRVMRVDTPINHGNSGGGLFNIDGELIGIVNAKTIAEDVDNIGYAIPTSVVRPVVENILDYCYEQENTSVMRPLLGVTITTADTKAVYFADIDRVQIVETIVVHEVSETSVVYGMLQPDDIYVSIAIGDRVLPVTRQYHIIDFMLHARLGDTVTLVILREGVEHTYTFTVTQSMITPY